MERECIANSQLLMRVNCTACIHGYASPLGVKYLINIIFSNLLQFHALVSVVMTTKSNGHISK